MNKYRSAKYIRCYKHVWNSKSVEYGYPWCVNNSTTSMEPQHRIIYLYISTSLCEHNRTIVILPKDKKHIRIKFAFASLSHDRISEPADATCWRQHVHNLCCREDLMSLQVDDNLLMVCVYIWCVSVSLLPNHHTDQYIDYNDDHLSFFRV